MDIAVVFLFSIILYIIFCSTIHDRSLHEFLEKFTPNISKRGKNIFKLLILFIFSIDYLMAKEGKYSIKKAEKNLDKVNSNDDLTSYIKKCNLINLLIGISLFFILVGFFKGEISKTIKNFILFFILYRAISRSFEIIFAFTKDVIFPSEKKSKLTSSDRIILAIKSYFEIIFNYSSVYYLLSKNESIKNITNIIKLSKEAFFKSFNLSTFSGQASDMISALQLLTSLVLVTFAIASYLSDIKGKNLD